MVKIEVTHVGSLPRSQEVVDFIFAMIPQMKGGWFGVTLKLPLTGHVKNPEFLPAMQSFPF